VSETDTGFDGAAGIIGHHQSQAADAASKRRNGAVSGQVRNLLDRSFGRAEHPIEREPLAGSASASSVSVAPSAGVQSGVVAAVNPGADARVLYVIGAVHHLQLVKAVMGLSLTVEDLVQTW
jgi:hypothetical protein